MRFIGTNFSQNIPFEFKNSADLSKKIDIGPILGQEQLLNILVYCKKLNSMLKNKIALLFPCKVRF